MIINIGVTTVIFTLIFKILPDAKIKSKDVIIGALVTTVLLLIGQWGNILLYRICKYRNRIWSGGVYGYFSSHGFIIQPLSYIQGAEFTKAWANELGGKIFPDEYAVATKVIEIREENKPVN